ncbi:MAG: PAS domain S-box protein [Marichromatium sp.]|nr:PAS domain S-box protein [Marichromatium sp.]
MSFRLKTILGIALIEAALLALLVFSALSWLRESNEAQLVQRATTAASLVATNATDAVLATDLARLESLLDEVLTNADIVYARVRDRDGLILAEAGAARALARRFVADQDPSHAADGVFDTRAEIHAGGAYFGRVELGVSVEPFLALLSSARSGAIGIALLEMALVALFSLLLGTYLSRQLLRLRDASNRIAREGPGVRIPQHGNDEIGEAIRAFNLMSARLADSYADLNEALAAARQLAERIRRSEAQKSALLDAALDAIVTIDLDGRVVDFNASAEQIFGYLREDVGGQLLEQLIVPERYRAAHRRGMARFRAEGKGRVVGQRLEMEALHRDGHEFPIEIAITEVEADETVYFTAFIRDISARRRAEEELRLAAQAFEAQEAIFITDAESRILRVNRAFTAITGYAPHEAIGETPRLLKSGRQSQRFYREMWARLQRDGHWEGEIENRRRNGEIFPEWLSITTVRDPDGRVTNYVANFIDISERKRTEAALIEERARAEQASEAKSRFLATMSHEIRTPLNAILNMNELLLESGLDPEQAAHARVAGEAGHSLLSVVDSILDFSKIEAGRMETRPEPCALEPLLEGVLGLFAARAFAKGVELLLTLDPQLPVRGELDPGQLRQILLNLLGNALKFTEHGAIELCAGVVGEGAEQRLSIEVRDTGIGIARERLSELFNEFVQVDDSRRRRFGGTGLGLAICRGLARIMGGEIGCASEPGVGSRFWVRLPLRARAPADDRRARLARRAAGWRVQVWAASAPLAEGLARQLRLLGLETVIVGEERWFAEAAAVPARLWLVAPPGAGRAAREIPIHRDRTSAPTSEAATLPLMPRALCWQLGMALGAPELFPAPDSPRPEPAAPTSTATAATGPILLVEDSEANRLVALAILERAGYRVETAADGHQALAALRARPYALVLMDVSMPGMDGLEATRAIRALPGERARVPIVAMTANAFSEDRERCLAAGMDDYLSKPVVRAELFAALARWLGGARPEDAPVGASAGERAAPAQAVGVLDLGVIDELAEEMGEDFLVGMLQTFEIETRRRVACIEQAWEAGEIAQLEHEAHTLKGASGTFGARALQALAFDCEQAARAADRDRLAPLIARLRGCAEQALEALVQCFAKGGDGPRGPARD